MPPVRRSEYRPLNLRNALAPAYTTRKITSMSNQLRAKKASSSRKAASGDEAVREVTLDASEMWRYKRENQRRDIEGLKSGVLTPDNVSWFSGGVARRAKVIGSLF